MLDKAEIWAQKYPHAHPMWFGSFSAFLVVTDPDYAKVLLSRGGERLWLHVGSSNTSLQISCASLKIYSKAGFHREVFLHKSSKGMERYPSFMLCPGYFRHRAPQLTWLQIHCWKIRLPHVLLENLTTQWLIPARRRHLGALF